MPVADTLVGFHASFVLLLLGAAGAWCIHGIILTSLSTHNQAKVPVPLRNTCILVATC